MVYLDHAATTPMRPEAIEALTAALAVVGNPSSIHSAGQQAKRLLVPAGEHHATIDTVEWLAAHEGAVVVELPLDELGRLRVDELEAELARDAASVARRRPRKSIGSWP